MARCLRGFLVSFSFVFLVLFSSHLLSSPFFSLSSLVETQMRGYTAGSSPPTLLRFVPCMFGAKRL